MIGSTYETCRHCGERKEAEYVDIGIGYMQVTPAVCPNECDYIKYLEGKLEDVE